MHKFPYFRLQNSLAMIVLAWLPSALGCSSAHRQVNELGDWMTGSFSSAQQAQGDSENYYDIRLQTARIWPARDDGIWLYVEQAVASRLDKPYRQRIYRVHALDEQRLESVVYTLPDDPLQYAGAWRTPACFDDITPADLTIRTGCSIILTKAKDGSYVGSTNEKDCESELRGATYATSHVVITPTMLTSWDRGYNDQDVQVWGATEGPYEFIKTPRAK